MKHLFLVIMALSSSAAFAADSTSAQPKSRSFELGAAKVGDIIIVGRVYPWRFSKVCIDEQVYILIDGITGPNGITVSFVDGKPETCIGPRPIAE